MTEEKVADVEQGDTFSVLDPDSNVLKIPIDGSYIDKTTKTKVILNNCYYMRPFEPNDYQKESNFEWFVQFYTNEDHMQYVHTRSLDYIKNYIQTSIASFSCTSNATDSDTSSDQKESTQSKKMESFVTSDGILDHTKLKNGSKLIWVIANKNAEDESKQTEENYVGSAEIEIRSEKIHDIDQKVGVFEILIDPSYCGRNLGTLTVLKLCQISFNILKCDLIRGMIVINNIGSIKAARAVGLRPRTINNNNKNGKIKVDVIAYELNNGVFWFFVFVCLFWYEMKSLLSRFFVLIPIVFFWIVFVFCVCLETI